MSRILAVPSAAYREALLAPTSGGARPPTRLLPSRCPQCGGGVEGVPRPQWMSPGQFDERDFCRACPDASTRTGFTYFRPSQTERRALVLAAGTPDEVGMLRLGRVVAEAWTGGPVDPGSVVWMRVCDTRCVWSLDWHGGWRTLGPESVPAYADPPDLGDLLPAWALGGAAVAAGVLEEVIVDR